MHSRVTAFAAKCALLIATAGGSRVLAQGPATRGILPQVTPVGAAASRSTRAVEALRQPAQENLDAALRDVSSRAASLRDAPPNTSRAPWLATLASAALPGAGQAMLGQQRALGYIVAEGFLVIRTVRAQKDANEARNRYRELAANVARLPFGTDRPAGPWEYYEILEESERYLSSGEYDLAVGGRFTPEADETTYNGRQWRQARETYWANPAVAPAESSTEYQRALAFYKARAVQGSFRWSWRDHLLEQAEYRENIRAGNRSKQNVVSALGLVTANHLVSLVDAYISVRLRRFGGAGMTGASLRTEVRSVGAGASRSPEAYMTLTVPFGSGR